MSHLSKIFNKVPVRVQDKSGFDLSHENLFSAKIGTLIPASVEEVMPGDVVSVGSAFSVELPPLATNFKGRVDARMEAFFVPNRLLWAGWQDFIVQDPEHKPIVPGWNVATTIPKVRLVANSSGAGSLSDYLGVKAFTSAAAGNPDVNALPYLAYWKIWDDWYRDSNVQQPFFVDGIQTSSAAQRGVMTCPYERDAFTYTSNNWTGYNGRNLVSLAQRNFAKDYFTTMTTQPQSGAAAQLQFTVENVGEDLLPGSFSIASLRAANSLQKWLERNNLGGTRYYDQILAHYGVLPADARMNRSMLLGSCTSPVIVNTVNQTSQIGTNVQTKNPYGSSTGAKFGSGSAFGKDRLIDNFKVTEHGYIIILFSLVPHAYYSTGTRRYLTHRSASADFAFPEFANIGDQPVYKSELVSNEIAAGVDDEEIGYTQRYAEYKYHDDEIHGLLQDGQSLNSFVLSRGFSDEVSVNSALLEIPTTFMDSVMVTTAGVSGFNCIVDAYFDAKYLRVLPEYSLPSLSSGEDGYDHHTVNVPKGGTRL